MIKPIVRVCSGPAGNDRLVPLTTVQFPHKVGAGDFGLDLQSDALAFHFEKRFGVFETETRGKLRVVPQDGVHVERKMSAVDREIILKRAFEQLPASPDIG